MDLYLQMPKQILFFYQIRIFLKRKRIRPPHVFRQVRVAWWWRWRAVFLVFVWRHSPLFVWRHTVGVRSHRVAVGGNAVSVRRRLAVGGRRVVPVDLELRHSWVGRLKVKIKTKTLKFEKLVKYRNAKMVAR